MIGNTMQPKDCNCSSHTVPHWVYMDAIHRWSNRRLALQSIKTGNWFGFAIEERSRLRALAAEMQARNCATLSGEVQLLALSEAAPLSRNKHLRFYQKQLHQAEEECRRIAQSHDASDGSAKLALAKELNQAERRRAVAEREAKAAQEYMDGYMIEQAIAHHFHLALEAQSYHTTLEDQILLLLSGNEALPTPTKEHHHATQ